MTAFDVDTGGIVKWDSFSGGSVNGTADSYTIQKRSTLVVDTDSGQCAGHSAAFGSIDNIYVSGSGGVLRFDARYVRQIPFGSGTSTVPAIGTTVSQGGVSGPLLGAWADWQSEPLAAGATMPTTGWIKLKSVTGGVFASGALTGISASATGPDEVSWIEARHNSASEYTSSRLLRVEARGAFMKLGVTTGSRGQVLPCPTTGTTANWWPSIWIEDAPGGTPQRWYSLAGLQDADLTTDEVDGRIFWQTTSGIVLGNDGTNDVGYLPPSGCAVTIPNVILTNCTRDGSGSGPRVDPTSAQFSAPGNNIVYDLEHSVWSLQNIQINSSSFRMQHSGRCGKIVEYDGTPIYIRDCIVSPLGTSPQGCVMNNVDIDGLTVAKYGNTGDNYVLFFNNAAKGVANDVELICAQGYQQLGLWMNGVSALTVTNLLTVGAQVLNENSIGSSVTDHRLIATLIGSADSGTQPIAAEIKTTDITYKRITFPRANQAPRERLFEYYYPSSLIVGDGILDGGAQLGGLIPSGYTAGIIVKRLFADNLRGSPNFGGKNQTWINGGAYGGFFYQDPGTDFRGVRGQYSGASGGKPWCDHFDTTTHGWFRLACTNDPVSTTFTGSTVFSEAQCRLPTSGDSATWEMHYVALGHELAENASLSITGDTTDVLLELAVDSGAGYGSWVTLSQANWAAIGAIDPAAGIRLKVRATATATNENNYIERIGLPTTTTSTAQANNLYPLDVVTVKVVGLVTGSMVRVTRTDTDAELFKGQESGGEIEFETDYSGQIAVVARKGSSAPYYRQWDAIDTLAGNNVTFTAIQQLD